MDRKLSDFIKTIFICVPKIKKNDKINGEQSLLANRERDRAQNETRINIREN